MRHCACIQAENCAGSEGEQIGGHDRWWDLRDECLIEGLLSCQDDRRWIEPSLFW